MGTIIALSLVYAFCIAILPPLETEYKESEIEYKESEIKYEELEIEDEENKKYGNYFYK